MRVAAFDLGSNSLKLLVVERAPDGSTRRLHEEEIITRISEGVEESGRLSDGAIERTLAALVDRARLCRGLGVHRCRCVATAGLRGAAGREGFVERARLEAGVNVDIIDGDAEAALAFRASERGDGPRLVVDVGGRSTELAYGEGAVPTATVSLPLGGVRLTERFLATDPPNPEDLATLAAHVDHVLHRNVPQQQARGAPSIEKPWFPSARSGPASKEAGGHDAIPVVGVSGTVVALAGLAMDEHDLSKVLDRAEGLRLSRQTIETQLQALASRPAIDRVRGNLIPAGRADVIVAGVLIVHAVLTFFGADELRVCPSAGVGWGVALELLEA